MLPAWWNDKGKRQNRQSKKQEIKRAKDVGGKRQAGSGSSWRAPQDVKQFLDADEEGHLEQIKYRANSYLVTAKEWRKLAQDARLAGREPRMVLDLTQAKIRLVIIEEPYVD